MGIFPLGFDFDHETEQATLAYYLKMAKRYIGSPMLSALYGVWAARSGNRKLSMDFWTEATAISAPTGLCKRWNTAKTSFPSNRRLVHSLQTLAVFYWG
jgi:hypothetical protein